MSLDQLAQDIADAGWLFNNCYQQEPDLWRVNLRRTGLSGDWFTSWAEAPTLAEALELCIEKMGEAEFIEHKKASFAIDKTALVESSGLLGLLGLLKPKEPIRRRL